MVDNKTVAIAVVLSVILSTVLSYGVIMTVPQVQDILRGSKGELGPRGEQGSQGIPGIICPSLKEEVDYYREQGYEFIALDEFKKSPFDIGNKIVINATIENFFLFRYRIEDFGDLEVSFGLIEVSRLRIREEVFKSLVLGDFEVSIVGWDVEAGKLWTYRYFVFFGDELWIYWWKP